MQHLENIKNHTLSIRNRMLLLAIMLGALFWVIDSAASVSIFNRGELVTQIFAPSPLEIWHRVLVLTFIVGFAFHANHMLNKHKRAMDALQASEEKYRQLVELSPDAIAIQHEDEIVFINPAGARLFGVEKPAQLVGRPVWDFVLPENQRLVKVRYRQMREEGKKASLIEQRFVRPDGTQVDAEVRAIPCVYNDSPAIQAIFHDITERKQAEAKLVKLQKAVEASGEVIFLTDREGIITHINPAFTRLYGHDVEEVVGQTTPRILKSGMMTMRDYELFWEALLNKQVVKAELVNRCKDGKLVTIEASANPILDDRENIIGFLAIQRDITERKRIEEELRQRNKELAALNVVATTMSQSLNLNQILNDALDEVLWLDVLGDTSKGVIFLKDEQTGMLSLAANRGAPDTLPCLERPPQVGECLCGLVVQQGEAIISDSRDKRHSTRWPAMPDHKDICLPLKVRDKIFGAMNLQVPMTQEVSTDNIELLTAVADQISIAIENARLFEAVNQQGQRLRAIGIRLIQVEESERRRLARELHDQVGQNLAALGINLNIIRSLLPEDVSGNMGSRLKDSLSLVDQTAERIRDVMADLRPSMLDDYGLVPALRWYGAQLGSRTGLFVTVQDEGKIPDLDQEVENTLFRIAQEALTNAAKHAQASNVMVTLSATNKTVCLVIADDGIGFDPTNIAGVNGIRSWGLLIMAERAEALNGRCWIESDPDRGGTRVIAEVES